MLLCSDLCAYARLYESGELGNDRGVLKHTLWLRNLDMIVSMVCSYSLSSKLNCLFSCWRVWFSMIIWALVRSSSDSRVSGGKL
jgi:hypothetical protein